MRGLKKKASGHGTSKITNSPAASCNVALCRARCPKLCSQQSLEPFAHDPTHESGVAARESENDHDDDINQETGAKHSDNHVSDGSGLFGALTDAHHYVRLQSHGCEASGCTRGRFPVMKQVSKGDWQFAHDGVDVVVVATQEEIGACESVGM